MLIEFSKMSFYLGESIPAEIVYRNETAEKIVIEDPAKSFEISMHALDSATIEDLNYTMGQIEVTVMDKAADQYSKSTPPKEMVTLEPGSAVSFSSDLNDRLYLYPGEFTCYLTEGPAESNRLKITVRFTRESVMTLVRIARDTEMGYGRREWAMDWLRRIYSRFELNLPYDEDTPEVKKEKELHNSAIIAEFLKWWNENSDSSETDTLLRKAEIQ